MKHKHKFKIGDRVFYHLLDISIIGYGVIIDTGYKRSGTLIYIVLTDRVDEYDHTNTQWMCCENDIMYADEKDFTDKINDRVK